MCGFVLAARRKLLERARQSGLGGFKKTSLTKPTLKEMWDGKDGKLSYCYRKAVYFHFFFTHFFIEHGFGNYFIV